jgi:hypothetical protein
LKIEGVNFNQPGEVGPWSQQRVHVGTTACIIDYHFTTAETIVCDVKSSISGCFTHEGAQHVSVDIMGLMGDYKKAILQDAFTFDAQKSFTLAGGSWAASGGDVKCFNGQAQSSGLVQNAADIVARIGDSQCQFDWCDMYEEEDQCTATESSCLAHYVGDPVKLAGCRAIGAGFCVWNGDSCETKLKKANDNTFNFCCRIPSGPELRPGSYILDVRLATGDKGQNSCSGTRGRNLFCGDIDPVSGRSFDIAIFPSVHVVSPSRGGAHGGNLITIVGLSFIEGCEDVDVLIGGVPCPCATASHTKITCWAGDKRSYAAPIQSGSSRGLRYEGYTEHGAILREIGPVASLVEAAVSTWQQNFRMEFTGQFRPRLTADYTFYITGDDSVSLYLGTCKDVESLALVATVPSHAPFDRESPATFIYHRGVGDVASTIGSSQQISATVRLEASESYAFKLVHRQGGGAHYLRLAMKVGGLSNATGNDGSPLAQSTRERLAKEQPAREWQVLSLGNDEVWRETWRLDIRSSDQAERAFQLRLTGPSPASVVSDTAPIQFDDSTDAIKNKILEAGYSFFREGEPQRAKFMENAVRCTRIDVSLVDFSSDWRNLSISVACPMDVGQTSWIERIAVRSVHSDLVVTLKTRASPALAGSFRYRLSEGPWSSPIFLRRACHSSDLKTLYSDIENAAPLGCDLKVFPSFGHRGGPTPCTSFERWEVLLAFSCSDVQVVDLDTAGMLGDGFSMRAWTAQDGDPDAMFYEQVGMEWFEMPLPADSTLAGVRVSIGGTLAGTLGAVSPTYQYAEELVPRLLAVFPAAFDTPTDSYVREGDELIVCTANLLQAPQDENASWVDDLRVTLGDSSGDLGRCEGLSNVSDEGILASCPRGTEHVLRCSVVGVCAGEHVVRLRSLSQGLASPHAPLLNIAPDIKGFWPRVGSLAGGTPITLSGSGVWCLPCSSITVAGNPSLEPESAYWSSPGTSASSSKREWLPVDSRTLTSRTCLTPEITNFSVVDPDTWQTYAEFDIAVIKPLSNMGIVGVFAYASNNTALVDRFTPSRASAAIAQLVVIEGSGFGGEPSPNVWFGRRKCEYRVHNHERIECWLPKFVDPTSDDCHLHPETEACNVPLGLSTPRVWIPDTGFAAINASFVSRFQTSDITPSVGSTEGGTEICVEGEWYDPARMLIGNGGYTDVVELEVLDFTNPWLVSSTIPCTVIQRGSVGRLCARCGAPPQVRRLASVEVASDGDVCADDQSDLRCFARAMLASGAVIAPPRTEVQLGLLTHRAIGSSSAPLSRKLQYGDRCQCSNDGANTTDITVDVRPGGADCFCATAAVDGEDTLEHASSVKARVRVRMNGVRAACVAPDGCIFSFSSEQTLSVVNVRPSEGSPAEGTVVHVEIKHGIFNVTSDNARVFFGEHECPVVGHSVRDGITNLTVPVCNFPASTVNIYVHIAPLGYTRYASPHTGSSFPYTQHLLLHAISPLSISSCGGAELTVRGTGFASMALAKHAEAADVTQRAGAAGPEPEPEPEPEVETSARMTESGEPSMLATEVVVCRGTTEPEPEPEPEPETEHDAFGSVPACLPCPVLSATADTVRCIAPAGTPGLARHVRVRVVNHVERPRGLWTIYYSGGSPVLQQLEHAVNFDGAWLSEHDFGAQDFEAHFEGFIYASIAGLYKFKLEANGGRYLAIDGEPIIALAWGGLNKAVTNYSHAVYLKHGPHFVQVRYVGSKNLNLLFKLSYKVPGFEWMCVPSDVLTPRGVIGSKAGDWIPSTPQLFYSSTGGDPSLWAIERPVAETVHGSFGQLVLVVANLTTSGGKVYIGSSAYPGENFECITTAWNDTHVDCTYQDLPAGTWLVRAFIPGYGWLCGAQLTLRVGAKVFYVEDVSGTASNEPTAVISGSYMGGTELVIHGAALGLASSQTQVMIDGVECVTMESEISFTKCVTGRFVTEDAVAAFPDSFSWTNLAASTDVTFFSDRGYSSIEADQAYKILAGNRKDEMINLFYGGLDRLRFDGEECVFGFELPMSKQALLHEAAIFPPVHPDRRKRFRMSVLQARLHPAAGWTDVANVDDLEISGDTIPQGWSTFQIDPPMLARHFRVVVGPDGCHVADAVPSYPDAYGTELLRSIRFNGVLLDVGAAIGKVQLARVQHPLALEPWSNETLVATIERSANMTPTLNCPTWPNHGTARGGTAVRLCGEGLAPIVNGTELSGAFAAAHAKVWLNGYPCSVTNVDDAFLECVTSPRTNGISPASIQVFVAGKGFAVIANGTENKLFQYIDFWSDPQSWVNSDFPVDGDSVQVPEGQAILLDRNSPQLFLLLIQGHLEFDRRDLILEATYIWIAGGHLRVGTEERPFLQNALIQMHGDRWKTIELPFIGSKMIAVTNRGGLGGGCHAGGSTHSVGVSKVPSQCEVESVGKLDIHGRPDISWTRLVRTAEIGATTLHLAEAVAWPIDSQLVITPSERGAEEEVRRVSWLSDGGYTVGLDKPLERLHLGTWYWHPNVSGPTDLRAAVGLLTKNILIRANASALHGSNGDFLFGVAVHAFFGGEMRIENVEFTRTGQAANFGRYSSHWHNLAPGRNVDVIDKAYLRNNSYHDTFQRCVVVHGTDYAVVKDNVCHRPHGHGFFTEAGDEDFTLMEHNLAINPQPHFLLLDDDTEPAGFWLPGFTGWHRHNMAANCHRGWRLRKVTGQGGETQTGLTFFNNSAHACGFGWHLKPPHAPPTTNHFKSFTAFRCGMGMFYYGTGNIVHEDHRFVECNVGHLNNHLSNNIHSDPFYLDSVLVGNIELDLDYVGAGHFDGSEGMASAHSSTESIQGLSAACHSPRVSLGFRWAKDGEYMLVSGLTVINYCNTPVMRGCFKNVCTMRFERWQPIHTYVYTDNLPRKSGIFWDLDGTLTGLRNGFVTFDTHFNRFPDLCDWQDSRHHNGIVCGSANGTLRLRRLTVKNVEPWQLRGKDLKVKTSAGESVIKWDWMSYTWEVPVVSHGAFECGFAPVSAPGICALEGGPFEYDMWPQAWNTFQRVQLLYTETPYVVQEHGYNHWERGYYRSFATPTSESVVVHFNFTHEWRDHFVVDSRRRRRSGHSRELGLQRKPRGCNDLFGAHAMQLWKADCDQYDWSDFGPNGSGNISFAPGRLCAASHPAATCGGPNELCFYDAEACGRNSSAAGCHANASSCRSCGGDHGSCQGDCPAAPYIYGVSRGACNGGYTDSTGYPLLEKLRDEPLLEQVGGRFTALLNMEVAGDLDKHGNGASYHVVDAPGNNDFSMTVWAHLCPEDGCPTHAPTPRPPPTRVFSKWSDAGSWSSGRVPGHMDDAWVTGNICLDGGSSSPDDGSIVFNWVTVSSEAVLDIGGDCDKDARRLNIGQATHYRLNVRSLVVWGRLELGTRLRPVPLGSSVTIAFYGDLFDHTLIAAEGLFVRNKALVVLGSLEAHGSVGEEASSGSGRRVWKQLFTTAVRGQSWVVVKGDARHWPLRKRVGISPTEYPDPLTKSTVDVSMIAAITYDTAANTSTINLTSPLNYSHFSGVVQSKASMGGHWEKVELSAYVVLLDGRSNIVFTTGESDQELIDMSTDYSLGYPDSQGHGGTVVIAGTKDGSFLGQANLRNVDFVRMGKRSLEHPALWFNFLGGHAIGDSTKTSLVEDCVFAQNMAGGLLVAGVGVAPLGVLGNVFHSTTRYGIWLVGPKRIAGGDGRLAQAGDQSPCLDDTIEITNNFVLDNVRSPLDTPDLGVTQFYRPLASFMLEVRPLNLTGNIAAGSADAGFALRPPLVPCASPFAEAIDGPLNEAVGCVIGFFYLRAKEADGRCGSINGVYAWKNAHVGVLTVDQSVSMRVSHVLVSDNHIGLMLNFAKLASGDTSMSHRIYGHNVTIFGSTPATSCETSTTCHAVLDGDIRGAGCNSVFGSQWRHAGLVTHMITRKGKTCEVEGMTEICDTPHMWFKMCVGPWEQRRGSLGARYSEAHWDKLTIGYFKKRPCGVDAQHRVAAITHNPSSIDLNFPNFFSNVTYLPNVDSDAKFFFEGGGRRDDGIWQQALIDVDGTLIGGGKANGSVIAAANAGLATASCAQGGSSIQCAHGDTHLKLNLLTWELLKFTEHRVFGFMKLLRISDDRASVSQGPHDSMCPSDTAKASRNWMVAPNETYNLTLYASPPKHHTFYYFNDRPECISLRVRLSQPFRIQVYVNGDLLDANVFDTARNSPTPRKPQLGDPHGSYTFDPHERTFFFVQCGGITYEGVPPPLGGGYIRLMLIQVVQLSLTVSVKASEFDQDMQRTFVSNIALLLMIPTWRIKVVAVQGIGSRRLEHVGRFPSKDGRHLQVGIGASIVIHILPAGSDAIDDTTNSTNSSVAESSSDLTDFGSSESAELTDLTKLVQDLVANESFASALPGYTVVVDAIEASNAELAPTVLPSAAPTSSPTFGPTAVAPGQTHVPTSTPSVVPTSSPTLAPTSLPTLAPTALPLGQTHVPTSPPTVVPTPSPTPAPSSLPTLAPTALPLGQTHVPISTFTVLPTPSPMLALPTLGPTALPPAQTHVPTSTPTLAGVATVSPTPSPIATAMSLPTPPSHSPTYSATTVPTSSARLVAPKASAEKPSTNLTWIFILIFMGSSLACLAFALGMRWLRHGFVPPVPGAQTHPCQQRSAPYEVEKCDASETWSVSSFSLPFSSYFSGMDSRDLTRGSSKHSLTLPAELRMASIPSGKQFADLAQPDPVAAISASGVGSWLLQRVRRGVAESPAHGSSSVTSLPGSVSTSPHRRHQPSTDRSQGESTPTLLTTQRDGGSSGRSCFFPEGDDAATGDTDERAGRK